MGNCYAPDKHGISSTALQLVHGRGLLGLCRSSATARRCLVGYTSAAPASSPVPGDHSRSSSYVLAGGLGLSQRTSLFDFFSAFAAYLTGGGHRLAWETCSDAAKRRRDGVGSYCSNCLGLDACCPHTVCCKTASCVRARG